MRRAGSILAVVAMLGVAAAWGQDGAGPPPFLMINQEQILTGSVAGRALIDDENRRRDALRTEARGLDAAFELEEQRLTAERASLDPAEFRRRADAFDSRVVQARREQDSRSLALAQEFDQRRRQFYARVAPILVMLMDRHRAKAILDENSVLLADQSLDITGEVIAEIDAQAAEEAPVSEPEDGERPAHRPAAPVTPADPEADEGE